MLKTISVSNKIIDLAFSHCLFRMYFTSILSSEQIHTEQYVIYHSVHILPGAVQMSFLAVKIVDDYCSANSSFLHDSLG
jgi:hypothetical protein